MDFLNKGLTQIGDVFRSLTPGARIVAALLVGVIVVGVGYLVQTRAAGPDEFLMAGQQFTPTELNAMEAAFGKATLSGWEVDGGRIRIPRGRRGEFMGALASGGALPADFGSHLRSALEQGGLFVSKKEREERLKIATQEELAMIIRNMRGIDKASVIYDIAMKPGLGNEKIATASVSVKPVGTRPLDSDIVQNIRHIVAASNAMLKPENVTITDLAGRTYPASGDNTASAQAAIIRQAVEEYQSSKRRAIEQFLSYIPGATVVVNAELQETLGAVKEELAFDKAKSVNSQSDSQVVEETRQSTAPGGAPGTRSNGSSNEPATVATNSEKNSSTRNEQKENVTTRPGGMKTTTQIAGLLPKRVTVAVGIPRTYFETVWRQRNNVADAAQKADVNAVAALEKSITDELKSSIARLLPTQDLKDPVIQVGVTSFDVLPQAEPEGPSFATNALAWLNQSWSTLGMMFLGAFSLLILRSAVRSSPTEAEPMHVDPLPDLAAGAGANAATQGAAGTAAAGETASEAAAAERQLKRRAGGVSLKEELAELVRDDPDTAASILRSWIGTAG